MSRGPGHRSRLSFPRDTPRGLQTHRARTTPRPRGVWAAADGGTRCGWVGAAPGTLQGTGRCTVASLVASGQRAGAAGAAGRPGARGRARPRSGSGHSLSGALSPRLWSCRHGGFRRGVCRAGDLRTSPGDGQTGLSGRGSSRSAPRGPTKRCPAAQIRTAAARTAPSRRFPSGNPRGLSSRDAGQQLRPRRPGRKRCLRRPVGPPPRARAGVRASRPGACSCVRPLRVSRKETCFPASARADRQVVTDLRSGFSTRLACHKAVFINNDVIGVIAPTEEALFVCQVPRGIISHKPRLNPRTH